MKRLAFDLKGRIKRYGMVVVAHAVSFSGFI